MRVLAEKTQRDTKALAMLALPGPTTSQARRADRSYDYKWISGPITTVHSGHIVPIGTAVTRVSSAEMNWFLEGSGRGFCGSRKPSNKRSKDREQQGWSLVTWTNQIDLSDS